jgi:hypothetical protein
VIKIAKEELEVPDRHQLKVDEIYLTARPKAVGHDGLDAGWGLLTNFGLDADGAGLREELGAITTNVVDLLAYATKQGITLAVVCAMMVFDIGVSSLEIADTADCVNVCHRPSGPKPEIQHDQRGRGMLTLT